MRTTFQDKGAGKLEVTIETWNRKLKREETACEAKCIIVNNECLVDNIYTHYDYKRQGFATSIISKLKLIYTKVTPVNVLDNPDAQGFWKSIRDNT